MTGNKISPKMLLLSIVVLVVTAALAAAVPNNQPITNSDTAIRTYLQPDLTFKSVLSPALLSRASESTAAYGGRTCRCSCGYPCKTNADCGPGGVCAPGITCCDKRPKDPGLESFQPNPASSRVGEAPVFNVVRCK